MEKSLFDKLYENVISDEEALGIDVDETDVDLDTDEEGSDEVTLTLDRATAEALLGILQGAVGDDFDEDFSDEEEFEDDFSDEDLDEEGFDDDSAFGEGTELEELKDGVPHLTNKSSQRVSTSWSASKKKGDGKIGGQDGKLKPQPDRKGKVTSKGNKKVQGRASNLASSKKNTFEE